MGTLVTHCFECSAEFKDVNDMHQKQTHSTEKGYYWIMVCTRCWNRSAPEERDDESDECPKCFQSRDKCDCYLDDVANAREMSYSWGGDGS